MHTNAQLYIEFWCSQCMTGMACYAKCRSSIRLHTMRFSAVSNVYYAIVQSGQLFQPPACYLRAVTPVLISKPPASLLLQSSSWLLLLSHSLTHNSSSANYHKWKKKNGKKSTSPTFLITTSSLSPLSRTKVNKSLAFLNKSVSFCICPILADDLCVSFPMVSNGFQ